MKRIGGRPRGTRGLRLYYVWTAMIQRCHNPKNKGYHRYGGRGISVCSRWRSSFDLFYADMGLPDVGMSIERVDANGNYSPDNCIWATRTQQNRNRPSWCRQVPLDGESMTLKEAWERKGHPSVTYRSFVKRVVTRNWPVELALSVPSGGRTYAHAGR